MAKFHHISVMPQEAVIGLNAANGGKFIDGTLGAGGHSRLILEANDQNQVLGIDQDNEALRAARRNLSEFGERFEAFSGRFSQMKSFAAEHGWDKVDGILLDIGVSSHQIDVAERGFSFREDGPLDMRMDRKNPLSASTIVNQYSADQLRKIFREYGETKRPGSVANAIVEQRKIKNFERTGELAKLIDKVDRFTGRGKSSAMLYFQALRIAVNDELGELERALETSVSMLKKGGRIAIITFHSLEDRMVKKFFNSKQVDCICPPEYPVCMCDVTPELKVVNRKVITAGRDELCSNSRANCAKLRIAEKL